MKLIRYEQETVIYFNAGDQTATLYTRDPTVMRKVDALVIEYPDIYKCIGETDIDKTRPMRCLNLSSVIVSQDDYPRSRGRRKGID